MKKNKFFLVGLMIMMFFLFVPSVSQAYGTGCWNDNYNYPYVGVGTGADTVADVSSSYILDNTDQYIVTVVDTYTIPHRTSNFMDKGTMKFYYNKQLKKLMIPYADGSFHVNHDKMKNDAYYLIRTHLGI